MAEALDEWVNRLGLAIDAMAHFDLGDGPALDYSPESLRGLTATVSAHFADPAEVLYDDEQPLVDGVVAYVGECLLRLARGQWEWDDAPGFAERARPPVTDPDLLARVTEHRWRFEDVEVSGVPVLRANPALELAAVSPLHLLLAELGGQPGVIVASAERWQAAVTAHAAAHPEWATVTEPTLTDGYPLLPPSAELDQWLARWRRDFPTWATTYGGNWDYSPGTVDALAALVSRVTPTVEAFLDPANADFTEGAAWYFGELLCRAYPSRWAFRGYLREPGDPLAVCFTVQTNDNRDFTGPFIRLTLMLKRRDTGWLRTGYDQWAETV